MFTHYTMSQNYAWVVLFFGWASLLIMPVIAQEISARDRSAATVMGKTLYVFGGKISPGNLTDNVFPTATNDLLMLNLATSFNTSNVPWSNLPKILPQNAPNALSAVIFQADQEGKQLAIFGGMNSNKALLPDRLFLFWTTNNTWSTPSIPSPGQRIMSASAMDPGGEYVYLYGGAYLADRQLYARNDGARFNLKTKSWENLQTLSPPEARAGHTASMLSDGRYVVLGGYLQAKNETELSTALVLDTVAKRWDVVGLNGPFPPSRVGHSAVVLDNDYILIYGGVQANVTTLDDMWLLSPQNWTWSRIALKENPVGNRAFHNAVLAGTNMLLMFGASDSQEAQMKRDLHVFDTNRMEFVTQYVPTISIPSETASQQKSPSPGAIAGGIIGTLVVVGGGLVAFFLIRRRRKQRAIGQGQKEEPVMPLFGMEDVVKPDASPDYKSLVPDEIHTYKPHSPIESSKPNLADFSDKPHEY
ncbi:uncharacterized protein VTP21DRAFT_10387 [Calcarisporiella thermophila]|uniref:uncharacterized protein n=1 Tax=Calcarisporiella thermophila TaxID=911321 RepID=UPI003742E9E5